MATMAKPVANENWPDRATGIQSEDASASSEDESVNEADDERVEKKSHSLPMFRQLKLYKPSAEIDGNECDDDDTAEEYNVDEEEEDKSEEDEEDSNEICRKLRHVCDNLNVPTQSLSKMLKLISKLWSGGYIKE